MSGLIPHLAELTDYFVFVHSLTSKSNTHGPAENFHSTGFNLDGFPGLCAWTTYALGGENQNLPAYVAIPDPRSIPQKGAKGRDHNPDGFTCWLTGAGVRAGVSHGETDELGRKAVKDVHPLYDFNATILHLLGLDHEKLTFEHNGVQRRLTSVEGNVIHEVLA